MGGRDYSHREVKKSKKSVKLSISETAAPSPEAELVKKRKARKPKEDET